MPLFKIDDRKVKEIIKDSIGAKEGDFNGQSMMCGTTVNPVVVVNGNNLKVDYFTELNFTNGVVTKVFDGLRVLKSLTIVQSNTETNDKNFTFRCENLDGVVFSTQIVVPNNSQKYVSISSYADTPSWLAQTTIYEQLYGIPIKNLSISQDSADGTAQTIVVKVVSVE